MSKSEVGGKHFYASGGQVDTLEERRRQHQRVHGRADVVAETGQGQLGGEATPTHRVRSLVDRHPVARTGQGQRSRQPVGAEPTTTASTASTGGTVVAGGTKAGTERASTTSEKRACLVSRRQFLGDYIAMTLRRFDAP